MQVHRPSRDRFVVFIGLTISAAAAVVMWTKAR